MLEWQSLFCVSTSFVHSWSGPMDRRDCDLANSRCGAVRSRWSWAPAEADAWWAWDCCDGMCLWLDVPLTGWARHLLASEARLSCRWVATCIRESLCRRAAAVQMIAVETA